MTLDNQVVDWIKWIIIRLDCNKMIAPVRVFNHVNNKSIQIHLSLTLKKTRYLIEKKKRNVYYVFDGYFSFLFNLP